jgi:hypothetical protein
MITLNGILILNALALFSNTIVVFMNSKLLSKALDDNV